MTKSFYALGRLKSGQMNKLEAEYALELERQKQCGEILWYKFEGIKLRLADNTFLTIDFAILNKNNELELRDVKGFMMDDANVKMKVAADMYPIKISVITKKPKKLGGGWETKEF